ncbi:MAG: TonB-dependent receptor, partial [Acidobacteria bacterium]|nr:TonB-dependent receptor [Acidobacteriota bacterium]
RTALAADPALRSFVNSLLAKYPDELPNRPDFDPRALNTNAPQRIDELNGSLRLDRDAGRDARLALSHALGRQRIDAFQFVAGQNPDTEIHNHRSRISYTLSRSPAAEMSLGFGFTRVRSDLRPEPNAAPMRIRIGFQIEELGPDSHFPIHRAQNSYRAGAVFRRLLDGGRHALTFGGDLTRFQLNGIETNNARGFFSFTNNFGRTAIENLRRGTPATYEVSLGALARGFRNWTANLFLGDQWKVNSRLQVYYGLRFNLDTTPTEVNALNVLPYGCDCNNFSPRLSIAWRLPGDWMARTSYTVSFGQILPVTYQQVRNNLPLVLYIQVQNPDLLDPLRGINLSDPSGRAVPTIFSPDLVAPYVHQYNFSLERALGRGYTLRLAYIGSRGIKLLNSHVDNRALPIAPLTLDTVDQRRPDPRYYEINRIVNGGIAYLDAVQAAVEGSYRNGLAWAAAYTFGKAIDQGSDYAFTAAGRDLLRARSQSQFESFKDKKSLSTFDSPHALLAWYAYDLPIGRGARGGWSMLARDWQISGSALLKSGTPLTLYIGSDAPGFGNVDGGPSDRPNILDPSILGMSVNDPDTAPLILRRDRFAFIRPYENRGSLGRNTFRKDSIANLNAAITRQWRWGGATAEKTLLFRVEAFNLTNHPQFDEPQRNLTSPSFGRITNTLNDGRVLQVGIRLLL